MVSFLLTVTFACGVVIAAAHVLNGRFVAPVYDVVLNLVAFLSATAASLMLGHRVPATFSAFAVVCWLVLARRTYVVRAAAREEPEAQRRKTPPISSPTR